MSTKVRLSFCPYTLIFKEPGGTSRGVLHEKLTFVIRLVDTANPESYSFGEVPVFKDLSKESPEEIEKILISLSGIKDLDFLKEKKENYPSSLIFGLEQAIKDLEDGGKGIVFPSRFTKGETSIQINGLVWMGSFDEMRERAKEKILARYQCIKIKIGSINWKEELELIKYVRKIGGPELIIRVDANGAFSTKECLKKLEELSEFDIHSIEQPIPAGNIQALSRICKYSPIPIALDEEIIGVPPGEKRTILLEEINPHFLILKPALCFGFSGTKDWINRASELNIGWWITSALESSLGLNAIAQFTGSLNVSLPQGLGTGGLFSNNFLSPLSLNGELLTYNGPSNIFTSELNNLRWTE